MITGKDFRRAIKIKGLTMEEAASKIGMTRANLYSYTNRAELENDFVQLVNTKLDIRLTEKLEIDMGLEDLFQQIVETKALSLVNKTILIRILAKLEDTDPLVLDTQIRLMYSDNIKALKNELEKK